MHVCELVDETKLIIELEQVDAVKDMSASLPCYLRSGWSRVG